MYAIRYGIREECAPLEMQQHIAHTFLDMYKLVVV